MVPALLGAATVRLTLPRAPAAARGTVPAEAERAPAGHQ